MRPLYETTAPVASVYLDTTLAVENAPREIALRWRGLRQRLAREGTDEATLVALDDVVGGVPGVPGPQGEALFASRGQVLAQFTLSQPPLRDHASWLPVADTLDLIADRNRQLPYVVVAADREGADVDAYTTDRHDPVSKRSFSGSTLHIQKVRVGGWSHKQYQRRSENLWDINAGEVAQDVEAAVADVRAELVFIGGDERAIGKLRDHLNKSVLDILVELPAGGRSDRAALASLREWVDRTLETAVAQTTTQVMAGFMAELGREGAVEGLPATAEALRRSQVETLLLTTNRVDEPRIWASSSDPLEVSTERHQLSDPESAFEGPASALLLRAATLSDAEFAELPDPSKAAEGTGALLRFTLTG